MITSKLIEYVRAELASGRSKQDIEKLLLRNGWPDGDVDAVLERASERLTKAVPAAYEVGRGKKVLLSTMIIFTTVMYTMWNYFYGQGPTDFAVTNFRSDHTTLAADNPPLPNEPTGLATANTPATSTTKKLTVENTAKTTTATAPKTVATTQTPTTQTQTTQTTQTQTQTQNVQQPTTMMQNMMQNMMQKQMGLYKDGTYKGYSENAFYGYVQVAAVIKDGKLSDIQVLDYPHDRSTSRRINNYAMPRLISEAIQAQSSSIRVVSGATDSSIAFRRSLGEALSSAKS